MNRFASRPAIQRGILLLTLAAVASFLATHDVKQQSRPAGPTVDTSLNYALIDFEALLLDELGQLAVTIEAPVLRNDASSGVGSVTRPDIFVREGPNEWRITSSAAVVSADREFVSLTGEVNMIRYNTADRDRLEIDTRDLLVNVTPRTASTESRVTIRQGGDRLTATGMKLDLVHDRFELLSDVSAFYDKP
ncbi:MAG: LPS export ABC transporter periplasmic protein LptC [Xanthomonadales bacterium]|nr:LPS export ABC transporter periplasmic protein LptC [Xanthomonadales bacterium]